MFVESVCYLDLQFITGNMTFLLDKEPDILNLVRIILVGDEQLPVQIVSITALDS